MQVPFSRDNYDEDGNHKDSRFHVRIFDPCSHWRWHITDWDGDDICFGWVKGFSNEWGFFSLEALSMFDGVYGIGLEVDVVFSPVPYSAFIDKEEAK